MVTYNIHRKFGAIRPYGFGDMPAGRQTHKQANRQTNTLITILYFVPLQVTQKTTIAYYTVNGDWQRRRQWLYCLSDSKRKKHHSRWHRPFQYNFSQCMCVELHNPITFPPWFNLVRQRSPAVCAFTVRTALASHSSCCYLTCDFELWPMTMTFQLDLGKIFKI